MSAGAFSKTKYETDSGKIVSVRSQPETLAAVFAPGGTNAAPTGAVTVNGRFTLNVGSRRRKPFSARTVTIRFTGVIPDGYKVGSPVTIPIMTSAVYNAITDQSTVTYAGGTGEVIYKTNQGGSF